MADEWAGVDGCGWSARARAAGAICGAYASRISVCSKAACLARQPGGLAWCSKGERVGAAPRRAAEDSLGARDTTPAPPPTPRRHTITQTAPIPTTDHHRPPPPPPLPPGHSVPLLCHMQNNTMESAALTTFGPAGSPSPSPAGWLHRAWVTYLGHPWFASCPPGPAVQGHPDGRAVCGDADARAARGRACQVIGSRGSGSGQHVERGFRWWAHMFHAPHCSPAFLA